MKKILEIINNIIAFLDGKKTYIGGGIVFIGGGLKALDIIDEETFKALLAIGGAITTYGIRHAIEKILRK